MKKFKVIVLGIFICEIVSAQKTEWKDYFNSGFGVYDAKKAKGNLITLNIEAALSKFTSARFAVDNYRVELVKTITYNNNFITSNTKANILSLGLDYGLHIQKNKWQFYTFVGAAICFIDEPNFTIINSNTLSIESKNVTRWAFRVSPGVKYQLKESLILFTELQRLTFFYKTEHGKNLLNGTGLTLGVATKI